MSLVPKVMGCQAGFCKRFKCFSGNFISELPEWSGEVELVFPWTARYGGIRSCLQVLLDVLLGLG